MGRRTVPAFLAWGVTGVLAGTALGWLVGRFSGLPARVLGPLALCCLLAVALDIAGQAAVRGRVNLVALRHAGCLAAVTVPVCLATGAPVRAGLDAVGCALAVALCLGRVGCLAAGCCHGRPAAYGVRYGAGHVAQGFPQRLAGVPLAPVPLLEAGGLALLVPVAVYLAPRQSAGTAFGLLAAGYAVLRGGLEVFRGDAGRPHPGGLSTAQWAAGALGAALTVAASTGWLPRWLLPAGVLAMAVVAAAWLAHAYPRVAALPLLRAGSPLLGADHVAQVAEASAVPVGRGAGPAAVRVATTSLGIRISRGRVPTAGGTADLYTISRAVPLAAAEARALTALLGRLHQQALSPVPGRGGVLHLTAAPGPDSPFAPTVPSVGCTGSAFCR